MEPRATSSAPPCRHLKALLRWRGRPPGARTTGAVPLADGRLGRLHLRLVRAGRSRRRGQCAETGRDLEGVLGASCLDGRVTRRWGRWPAGGVTVWWPMAGTADAVAVDLDGMPEFGRDRTFLGYRGSARSGSTPPTGSSGRSPCRATAARGAPPPAALRNPRLPRLTPVTRRRRRERVEGALRSSARATGVRPRAGPRSSRRSRPAQCRPHLGAADRILPRRRPAARRTPSAVSPRRSAPARRKRRRGMRGAEARRGPTPRSSTDCRSASLSIATAARSTPIARSSTCSASRLRRFIAAGGR
jgi:hypothetical protein